MMPDRSWSGRVPEKPLRGSRWVRLHARFLPRPPISRSSHTWCASGLSKAPSARSPRADERERVDASPVRCLDEQASADMEAEITAAHKDGDTLGGVVEVVVHGLPPGLGSHVHWDRRIDGRLAAALMGIQAIKGVEVGDGFGLAAVRGSQAQDEIVSADGQLTRTSGRSGGTEGGMTTGEVLRVRAAMKPISTIPRALSTVDVIDGRCRAGHQPALGRMCCASRRGSS